MYLHGMSSGAFPAALAGFFGSPAGLSASVITRLTTQWQAEARAFVERDLSDRDYVYVWAGVHFNVRLEEKRLCALVIVGVRADGTKELVAIGGRPPRRRRISSTSKPTSACSDSSSSSFSVIGLPLRVRP